jgi:hypothetical protein
MMKTPAMKAGAAALAFSLLLLSGPAPAQWMWRSADGRINASDRPPPPGVAPKDIIRRPSAEARSPASATAAPVGDGTSVPGAGVGSQTGAAATAARAASAPPTALEREALARKKAAEKERADKSKADEERLAAQRASNCRSARGAVASLESGMRIVRANEQGEREVLDDRSRAEELRRARDAMSSECR